MDFRISKHFRPGIVLGAAIILIATVFIATACSDSSEGSGDDVSSQLQAMQEDIDSLHASLTRTQVFTAMQAMRVQDMHQLNLDVQAMSSLEEASDHETRLRRVSEAVRVTSWPQDFQAAADDLKEKLAAARQAFTDGDLAAAKETVMHAHDAWHVLDSAAADFLGAESDHANDMSDMSSEDEPMEDMSEDHQQ